MSKKKSIFAIGIGALLVGFFFIIPRKIDIASIECTNQFATCSESIQTDLNVLSGDDLHTVRQRIITYLSKNVKIESYTFHYRFPDTYVVTIIEKTATFSIRNTDYNSIALLSSEGEVLSLVEESALPSLTVNDHVWNIGDRADRDIWSATSLAESLYKLYPNAEYTIRDNSLVVNNLDTYVVYFPLTGERDVLLGSLTLILSRLKLDEEEFRIEGDRKVQEIDLRFKNPVLR